MGPVWSCCRSQPFNAAQQHLVALPVMFRDVLISNGRSQETDPDPRFVAGATETCGQGANDILEGGERVRCVGLYLFKPGNGAFGQCLARMDKKVTLRGESMEHQPGGASSLLCHGTGCNTVVPTTEYRNEWESSERE